MKQAILWGMGIALALGILLLLFARPAAAQTPARVVSVYDGDTITVDAAIWPGLTWRGGVRVRGADTPEIRGRCEREKRLAVEARDFVRDLVAIAGPNITLHHVTAGKFAGRVVAAIEFADGTILSQALIVAGLGRPYDGGTRDGWC